MGNNSSIGYDSMLSIIKDQWFKRRFKNRIKEVPINKVDCDVILDWVKYASLVKYVNTDLSTMLTTKIRTKNSCEELYKEASVAAKKLKDNKNHSRQIPDDFITETMDSWFIDYGGNVVLVGPYIEALGQYVFIMASALKEYKNKKDPDYEYHRLRTVDIFIDYHCLMLAVYGLK